MDRVRLAEQELAEQLAKRAAAVLGIDPPKVAWLPRSASKRGEVRGSDPRTVYLLPGQSGQQLAEAISHECAHLYQLRRWQESALTVARAESGAHAFAAYFLGELGL